MNPQAIDQIVLVLVASVHRGDAFQACEFIMDYFKDRGTFWKKESTGDGTRWVEAREADDHARPVVWLTPRETACVLAVRPMLR